MSEHLELCRISRLDLRMHFQTGRAGLMSHSTNSLNFEVPCCDFLTHMRLALNLGCPISPAGRALVSSNARLSTGPRSHPAPHLQGPSSLRRR